MVLATLAACSPERTGPTRARCETNGADLTTLGVFGATTVRGADLECVTLAADAEYVVLPQFLGADLPYVYYPFVIGTPEAPITSALATRTSALRVEGTQEKLHRVLRNYEATAGRSNGVRSSRLSFSDAAVSRLPLLVTDSRLGFPATATATDSRSFSVLSTLSQPPRFDSVASTLKFSGDNILLYLDQRVATTYTDAEAAALGALFDDVLYPVDRSHFGAESDIDGNGRVIVLVTPTVNALVAASDCATLGWASGFFYGFDLAGAAPQSNRGEIFYAMSPDPTGVYSCPHTKSEVSSVLPGTFSHELQHMISYGQRVVGRGQQVEVPWLNEGLSHIAEELAAASYEARYPAPAGRTDPNQLFPDSAGPIILPNLFNSYRYLRFSEQYSVSSCAPGSFCATPERGGAWLFLRWLRDATGDEHLFSKLLQSNQQGRANVASAAGRPFEDLFADFAIAAWADSLEGFPRASVQASYRFTSRNLRRLYAALYQTYGIARGIPRPFPVAPIELRHDERLESAMRPGTFQAFVVRTPASSELAIALTSDTGLPLSQDLAGQLSIMRVPRQ